MEAGSREKEEEALLALFFCALRSFKASSLLRPFPPGFADLDELRRVAAQIPPLSVRRSSPGSFPPASRALLEWVTNPAGFGITTVSLEALPVEVRPSPDLVAVFEVQQRGPRREVFERRRREELEQTGKPTFFAFHGSAPENFYSILHYGLHNHLTKPESLFGEGIYLSTNMTVSLSFSPFSLGWRGSAFGEKISVLSIGEVVPDRLAVQQGVGELPKGYVLVRNNEMVAVRYLLFFGSRPSRPAMGGKILRYLARHLILILVVLYVLFLALVGSSSSKH